MPTRDLYRIDMLLQMAEALVKHPNLKNITADVMNELRQHEAGELFVPEGPSKWAPEHLPAEEPQTEEEPTDAA
jgi:hypothetical protein